MTDEKEKLFKLESGGVTIDFQIRTSNKNVLVTLSGFGDRMTIEMDYNDAFYMSTELGANI